MLEVDLPLLHQVLVHPLAVLPGTASQRATVRSSSPNAATIACVGQP